MSESANSYPVQSSAQYRAVAWLRWRIFLNQFRRKGSTSEIAASILLVPFAIAILIVPTVAAGIGAGYFASQNHFDRIAWILWGAFFFCQFLNVQLGQPGTTFDPTQLIRFPLRVADYIAIRLFFGLLSPANIASFFIALAIAVGITVELPNLWLYTFPALFIFFAVNVLFSRMAFAWIDRWLSTRRAREVFTTFIFLFSLGAQWANFTFNPAYHHGANSTRFAPEKLARAERLYHSVQPWLAGFPPDLTASALQAAQGAAYSRYLIDTLFVALYAAIFYFIFAWRTRSEYRGENFGSQAGTITVPVVSPARSAAAAPALSSTQASADSGFTSLGLAVIGKDFLSMRRNVGIFYALIGPLLPALYLVIKNASLFQADWLFPTALGVSIFGLAPLSFNAFGLEGAGCQMYFMAPIRLRDIFLAKNIMGLAIGLGETVLVYIIISLNTSLPSLRSTVATITWLMGTLLLCMTLGNRRSITAPKKIEVGRASSRQTSQASSLIGLGIVVACAAIGAAIFATEWYFQIHWLLLPGFAIFAAASVIIYRNGLRSIDAFAYDHREELFAELCKQ